MQYPVGLLSPRRGFHLERFWFATASAPIQPQVYHEARGTFLLLPGEKAGMRADNPTNFLNQIANSRRLISLSRALASFLVRRGNLPPSWMKLLWRVIFSLSSSTSMAVTAFSLARIFSSPTASSISTGDGSGPKRSRSSFCNASSAGLSVACASLR